MISPCQMSKKMSDQVVNKELDLNWCQPQYDLLKLLRRIFFFRVCNSKTVGFNQPLVSFSRASPSWKDWNWPSSSWAKWDTPSLWGLTAHLSSYLRNYFPPKGLIPNVNSICKRKKKNMQTCLVSALNASFKEQKKRGKIVFLLSLLRHQGKKWQWLQIHTVYKKF